MKINEVITEAGLLGKSGRGLGAAAIAPIRALDIMGGGSGNVGTKSQIAARQQAAMTKANQVAVKKAYDQFAQTLAPQGVKLNDPRTYNQSMKDMLQAFAVHYYGSDYTTGPVIQQELNKIPVPTALNPGSIRDYLNKTGEIYVDVNNNMLSYKQWKSLNESFLPSFTLGLKQSNFGFGLEEAKMAKKKSKKKRR